MQSEEKMAVIIPVRDREEHLKELMTILPKAIANVKKYDFYVIEQSEVGLFNKGKVINAGFDILKEKYQLFCFHDVDTVPMQKTDYSYSGSVTHLSPIQEQFNFNIAYEDYFGGVIIFSKDDFQKINGFSNMYWGWGCEDDDCYLRCKKNNLPVVRRWQVFRSLYHTSERHKGITYKKNMRIFKGYLRSRFDHTISGLNNLTYQVLKQTKEKGYTRFLIEV